MAKVWKKVQSYLIYFHLRGFLTSCRQVIFFVMFRYNALDVSGLVSFEHDGFHCESCNKELVEASDELASQDIAGTHDNARRLRHEKPRDFLQNLEVPYCC